MSETKPMPHLDLGEVTDGEGRPDPMQGYITIGEGDEQTEIELRGLGAAKTAKQIVRAVNAHDDLVAALEEIAKGEGAFSRDPLEHAENCIDSMKEIARAALSKARQQT